MSIGESCTLRFLSILGVLAGTAMAQVAPPPSTPTPEPPRAYCRFPAIHGDQVVFTAEGDLWRVPVTGGTAQRITTHPGTESHASISPDGRWLAFSAEYEGPVEVYVMPLAGGLPKRLTHEASTARVTGWSPDGRVVYSTDADATLPARQLARVHPETGERDVIPLAQANQGTWDPTTGTLYFTRFPKQGSATKRYRGGWIENLWRYAPGDAEATPLTKDFPGTSRTPLWAQGRLYFVSDRDGTQNLWSMKPDGSDARQHTTHRDLDIRHAAVHGPRIVYQRGADLWVFDIATGNTAALDVRLVSDLDQQRERWVKKPLDYLTSAHLSSDGERLALTARGQVFVAPLNQGRFVELPRTNGFRHRNAQFIPGTKDLVVQTDETGEIEFTRIPANGLGTPTLLTTNGTVFRFTPVPSPDGRWLAWIDKDFKLWIHHIERRETRLVTGPAPDAIDDLAWSPDSQWLAYAEPAANSHRQIQIAHTTNTTRLTLTSDRTDSSSPTWSHDGKWIYFLSDRRLRSLVSSPWGLRQPEPFFTESTLVFGVALQPGQRWPFKPADELSASDAAPKDSEKPKDTPAPTKPGEANASTNAPTSLAAKPSTNSPASKGVVVTIDTNGLATRLYEVPIPAGNLSSLSAGPKHLLWISRDTGFDAKPQLQQLEITAKDPKPKTLVEDVGRYEITPDGKKLLVRKGDTFHVIASDASAPAKLDDKFVLDGWTLSVVPREEWRQVLTEAWRMMRDYFYDPKLHGVDWRAVHARYLPLVDRVTDRAELSDLIEEMIGELSTLHLYVRYGDIREGTDKVGIATLGARLTRDVAAGGWRIAHIHRADPEYPRELSPLARPGVDVAEGDVITTINGRATLSVPNPSLLLRNQAERQTLLTLATAAGTNRQVLVEPISANRDAALRYDEWEYTRRLDTERLGNGCIGYVHLRAMGTDNMAEWARHFYPVFDRAGLVIDVRNNQGGNIDSWILNRLLRKAWFYWQGRAGQTTWNMHYAFRGHVVVLCNERTASDGEAFSEGFKRLGLGKVIGTRTWGGEVWLSAQRWLVDNGMASAAEFGVYGPEGAWLIEGHGVDPDITVDNLPRATFNGGDAQLEAAIRHLQDLIMNDPRPVPPVPPRPIKTP